MSNPISGQEKAVFNQLKALDWEVWSSVSLLHKENDRVHKLAEYNAIGILHYQLFHFECKRLSGRTEEANEYVWRDLYKLYQVQQHFGGPFGKSYWIFSGDHQLHEANRERLRDFRITLIGGAEIDQIESS